MADNEREFKIKLIGDASSLVGATQQGAKSLENVGIAQDEAGKKAEKHSKRLAGMSKAIGALNQVIPGLGVILQAAFSPIAATISLAVMALRLFQEHLKAVNAELDKMAEENAKSTTSRFTALREATVEAAVGMDRLHRALADAARTEQTVKESVERTVVAFKEEARAGQELADAMKENYLSGIEEEHASLLLSEKEYAVERLEIEKWYQNEKRALAERSEATEILIKWQAMNRAKQAQPGLTSAAELAELNKTKALEDLGSLDKGGVEDRYKKTGAALGQFEDKYSVALRGFGIYQGGGPKEAGFSDELYEQWVRLKAAAGGAAADWRNLPGIEARRKVAADRASANADRATKAAVENQGFITGAGRDIGDRVAGLDARHEAGQQIIGLQGDTALRNALAKTREKYNNAVDQFVKIVEAGHGVTAAQQDQIKQLHSAVAELERRVRAQEGRTPRI